MVRERKVRRLYVRFRQIIKRVVPTPIRQLGWDAYYSVRGRRPKAIVGVETTRMLLALTFDDGPDPDATPALLDVLDHYGAKATFFLLGRNIVTHPEIARDIAQRGHAVGNHTFSHPHLPSCAPGSVYRELLQCQRAIQETIGLRPTLMRPPFGEQDPVSLLIARLMGYTVVHWSASGEDYQGDPASLVVERIVADVQPGGIILLHDGWEPPPFQTERQLEVHQCSDRSPVIDALPRILESLQKRGHQFVTVPEMIRMGQSVRREWLY